MEGHRPATRHRGVAQLQQQHRRALHQPDSYANLAVSRQQHDPSSTLELYRALLAIRRDRRLGSGTLKARDLGADIVAFDVESQSSTTRIVLNLGPAPWRIPADCTVIAHSEQAPGRLLLTDRAVWLEVTDHAVAAN